MGKSVNKVILLGNVGRDPDVRVTGAGDVVVNFSVATTDSYKGKDTTEWHNCVAFSKAAELIRDHVKKGHRLYVEGKIVNRKYTSTKTGEEVEKSEIKVLDVTFLTRNDDTPAPVGQRTSASRSVPSARPRPVTEEDPIDDSDVPF